MLLGELKENGRVFRKYIKIIFHNVFKLINWKSAIYKKWADCNKLEKILNKIVRYSRIGSMIVIYDGWEVLGTYDSFTLSMGTR